MTWALFLGVLLMMAPAFAQQHPFAVGGQETLGSNSGLTALILAWQNKFNSELQHATRALKSDPRALATLMLSSFAYGIFHAAGPGHGKAVLTSYMIANETALKRGLILAGLAALLQGAIAIALVSIAAAIFNATAGQMKQATNLIDIASYSAIMLLGARLSWLKGQNFINRVFSVYGTTANLNAHSFFCDELEDGKHEHGPNCNHYHAPNAETLNSSSFSWREAITTIIAAGLRPCSGAILILVFTLSQNLFYAGIAATLMMSLGTAITTGALAAIAVYAKNTALRWTRTPSQKLLLIGSAAELSAAVLVLSIGLFLLCNLSFGHNGA
jgi:nickel/cobalt transporter (NicO) family protein